MHHPFLRIIVPYSALIPISLGLFNYRCQRKSAKIIFYYLLFATVTEVISTLLGLHHIPNLMLLHFYTAIEFIFLSAFFIEIFTRQATIKAVKIIGWTFTILCIVNAAFFQKITEFNTYTRSLEALLVAAYCLMYFEQESRIKQTDKWEKKANNWFITSMLFYFSGCFFLFLFSNVMTVKLSDDVTLMIWNLHGVFLIIMHLLFAIGFWNEYRNR